MTALTRRWCGNKHQKTWHAYFGDICVGTIGERAGVPVDVDQWGWSCGFYPGLEPGQHAHGSAETFELARAGFEQAWSVSSRRSRPAPSMSTAGTGLARRDIGGARSRRTVAKPAAELADALRLRYHLRQPQAGREP